MFECFASIGGGNARVVVLFVGGKGDILLQLAVHSHDQIA